MPLQERHNSTLLRLDASRTGIGNGGFASLALAVAGGCSLTDLQVNENRTGQGGMVALAASLATNTTTLVTLGLCAVGLNTHGESGDAPVIIQKNLQASLDQAAQDSGMRDSSCASLLILDALAKALAHPSLDNNVRFFSVPMLLATALGSNTSLANLDLGLHGLDHEALAAFNRMLGGSHNITRSNPPRDFPTVSLNAALWRTIAKDTLAFAAALHADHLYHDLCLPGRVARALFRSRKSNDKQ